MSEDKKQKVSVSEKNEGEEKYEKSIQEMADAVIVSLKPDYKNELEPFEQYAERVKAKIHSDMDDFRGRLSKGYKVLLDEIQKDHHESHAQGSIKP